MIGTLTDSSSEDEVSNIRNSVERIDGMMEEEKRKLNQNNEQDDLDDNSTRRGGATNAMERLSYGSPASPRAEHV